MSNAIMVDAHKTLINEDGSTNINLCNLIKYLKKSYDIFIVTGRHYHSENDFNNDLERVKKYATEMYYNVQDMPNDEFKLQAAATLSEQYDCVIIIDNNKKVIKKLHKAGFNTLRYKELK